MKSEDEKWSVNKRMTVLDHHERPYLSPLSTLRAQRAKTLHSVLVKPLTRQPIPLVFQHVVEQLFGVGDGDGGELRVSDAVNAVIASKEFAMTGGVLKQAPVIDCQPGALRDDFDFGGALLYRTSALKEAAG